MKLDRAARMQSALLLQIGSVGFLRSSEATDMPTAAFPSVEGGNEASPLFVHAEISGLVGLLRIALILVIKQLRYVAQIAQSVVGRVAVDVINLMVRPLAMNVQPRKPMYQIHAAIQHGFEMTVRAGIPDDRTNRTPLRAPGDRRHDSSVWTVRNEFPQALGSNQNFHPPILYGRQK